MTENEEVAAAATADLSELNFDKKKKKKKTIKLDDEEMASLEMRKSTFFRRF